MASISAARRTTVTAVATHRLQQQLIPSRCFSAAASSPSSLTPSPTGQLNPLNLASSSSSVAAGGLGLSQLARPGGRQSVSGIVATVFGGSGFLGRYVANNLGRIGSQVIAPYRGDGLSIRHVKLAGDLGQIVVIPNDFTDLDAVRRCVARSNVVINCIGKSYETDHYTYDDVHAKIPYRIAQVSKAMGVERFIHVSAFGADENSESEFFKSKAAGEAAVKEFYPDATIIRPTVMFGPQDRFLSYYAYMGHKLAAVPLTRNGERKFQPVFVADVARAILNSIADPNSRGQTYEFAGNNTYTEAELIALVAKHTSSDVRAFYMPDFIARLYGMAWGGRRGLDLNLKPGVVPGAKIINTLAAFANKISYPSVYNSDMVAQAHTDLVLPKSRKPGLAELGIQQPMDMEQQLDRILFPHRLVAPDRFPEAEKMKRDAKNNASY